MSPVRITQVDPDGHDEFEVSYPAFLLGLKTRLTAVEAELAATKARMRAAGIHDDVCAAAPLVTTYGNSYSNTAPCNCWLSQEEA